MLNAMISVKIEPELKEQAQDIANKLGVNLSTVVKTKLREFVRTKSLNLTLEENPSKELIKVLRKTKSEEKSPVFDNHKDAMNWLEKQDAN